MDDKTTAQPDNKNFANEYRGLGRLLHAVRWTQHLLSIVAEALILLSFAMSGMDVSLGGVLAEVPFIKVLWAGMFALGIDTAFALSWVRVRQCIMRRRWLPFTGNLLLALSMSIIIFQPLAIQLLQESLGLNFNQAVANLGVNIVFLTYARSAVAVFLGAILAMTNVEDSTPSQPALAGTQPKRQFILIERLFQKAESVAAADQTVSSDDVPPAQSAPVVVSEEQSVPELQAPAKPDLTSNTTPEQRAQKVSGIDFTGLSARERVAKVLKLFPDLSDRELGKLSSMSAATAKKHREALMAQAAKEDGQ